MLFHACIADRYTVCTDTVHLLFLSFEAEKGCEDITFYEKTLNFAIKSKQKLEIYYWRGINKYFTVKTFRQFKHIIYSTS